MPYTWYTSVTEESSRMYSTRRPISDAVASCLVPAAEFHLAPSAVFVVAGTLGSVARLWTSIRTY